MSRPMRSSIHDLTSARSAFTLMRPSLPRRFINWSGFTTSFYNQPVAHVKSNIIPKFQFTDCNDHGNCALIQSPFPTYSYTTIATTSYCSSDSERPHRCCHLLNNFDSPYTPQIGFKSQSRRCRVTVLGKLFTPIVPLFTKQQNW